MGFIFIFQRPFKLSPYRHWHDTPVRKGVYFHVHFVHLKCVKFHRDYKRVCGSKMRRFRVCVCVFAKPANTNHLLSYEWKMHEEYI